MTMFVRLESNVFPMRLGGSFLLVRVRYFQVEHPCSSLHPRRCQCGVVLGVMSHCGVMMVGPPLVDGIRHIDIGWWDDVDG